MGEPTSNSSNYGSGDQIIVGGTGNIGKQVVEGPHDPTVRSALIGSLEKLATMNESDCAQRAAIDEAIEELRSADDGEIERLDTPTMRRLRVALLSFGGSTAASMLAAVILEALGT